MLKHVIESARKLLRYSSFASAWEFVSLHVELVLECFYKQLWTDPSIQCVEQGMQVCVEKQKNSFSCFNVMGCEQMANCWQLFLSVLTKCSTDASLLYK